MFEHKNLDGQWNRVISASEAFVNSEVLELRDATTKDPKTSSRRQFSIIGDRLVERCLPPETVGDKWSHDAADIPWWVSVNNPPHVGIVASFNEVNGGKHRQIFQKDNNIVAYAAEGEAITFAEGLYATTRQKDAKAITAPTLIELRNLYFAQ